MKVTIGALMLVLVLGGTSVGLAASGSAGIYRVKVGDTVKVGDIGWTCRVLSTKAGTTFECFPGTAVKTAGSPAVSMQLDRLLALSPTKPSLLKLPVGGGKSLLNYSFRVKRDPRDCFAKVGGWEPC